MSNFSNEQEKRDFVKKIGKFCSIFHAHVEKNIGASHTVSATYGIQSQARTKNKGKVSADHRPVTGDYVKHGRN